MFLAAFIFALALFPQAWQSKTAWFSRFSAQVCPQAAQRFDV